MLVGLSEESLWKVLSATLLDLLSCIMISAKIGRYHLFCIEFDSVAFLICTGLGDIVCTFGLQRRIGVRALKKG